MLFSYSTSANHSRHSTTVFGVDDTSRFTPEGLLVDSQTSRPIPSDRYKNCRPRPIPQCLDDLRKVTEIFTDSTYNFCLVNYYATGSDSISYHSDDERFLGTNPSIARCQERLPDEAQTCSAFDVGGASTCYAAEASTGFRRHGSHEGADTVELAAQYSEEERRRKR